MMQVPEDEFSVAAKKRFGSVTEPDINAAAVRLEEQKQVRLRTSLYQSIDTNPDEAARAKNLSNKSGIPVDVVQRNFPQVNRNVRLNEFDEALLNSPVLGRWMSEPNNAKISHDDSANLASIEREYGSIKPIERTFLEEITEPFQQGYAGAKKNIGMFVEGTAMMKGLRSRQQAAAEANGISYDPKIQQKINLQNYQRNVEKFPTPPEIQRGITELSEAESIGEFASAMWRNPMALKEVALQSLGVATPGLAVTAAATVTGPVGASTLVPFLSQQAIRRATAIFGTSYFNEYFSTIDEVVTSKAEKLNSTDALYKVITDEEAMKEARDKAVGRGVPIAFFDALTAGLAGKLLAGAKPTVGSVASRVLGESTLQATGGAVGEATAQIVTEGKIKLGEVLLEAVLELPTALVEIPGNYKSTMLQAESAERSAKAFEKVQEFSRASKVRARSAETFGDWINQVTEETDVNTVFISGETLKQSGLAERVAEVSPSVRDQLDTAIATGGDIAIPVTEYQTNIAPTEFSTALIDDLRIEGETMTRRQAREFIDNQAEIMKIQMEENAKVEITNKEFMKSARQVETTMFQQLKATKQYTDNAARINAQLVRDFVVTQAASLKIMPTEFYDRYMYRVERAEGQVGGMALFNQNQQVNTESDAFRNWFGASMFQSEQGRPQMLYHGTADNVTAFDPDHPNRKDSGWLGTGVYLTDSADMAEVYAMQKRRTGLDGENVMPLYARLENPYMATMEDKARIRAGGREAADAFTAELQAQGYDGVILEVAPDAREIVVFDPAAVKSPFNDGTWSRENADILRQGVKRNKKRKEDYGKPEVFVQSGAGGGGVQRLRASDLNVAQRYGTARDGATSVLGIHYSKQPRNSLTGFAYDTGLKGAEAGRLAGGDPRLANRVHFYVDTGNGIQPEAGVGGNVHAVYLDNLYDASADPLGLRAQASAMGRDDRGMWFNNVESAILDAGFDGVYIPGAGGDQGVAVLLGPQHTAVPVEQHGMHSMPTAGATAAPGATKRRYAMLTSEIRKFEAQEAVIKAAAPSAELRAGTLTFDEADAQAVAKFFPPAAKVQPLRQQDRGGFDPKRLTTILNERTDMSTFLHETAHFFLTVYADMASRPDATEQNKEDMQTVLDWFGVKDLATWNALSLDEQRKYHESWAYNYEIYLFEGKAPSVKMQSIFKKFSDWLKAVYGSIREELNAIYRQEHGEDLPILTGEVRQVMDRMLASDAQIKQSEAVNSMVPMFQTQEESGMTDEEWAAYQDMMAEATEASVTELTQASLRQLKWLGNARSRVLKKMQAKTADIRKGVREEVAAEVQEDRIYKVMEFLKRGTFVDENGEEIGTLGGQKLKIADVKALYPESKETLTPAPDFKKLGYGKYGMLAEDGLSPDLVASMFGFDSGDQLVRSLLDARPIKEEIDMRTDARMLDEYADLMDPASIELEVQKALHNEARARFVAVELRYLAKATQAARLIIQAAKTAAKSIIGNKVISEIRPRDYTLAEARAAKESTKASKAGKITEAVKAKQNQLLNNQLALEAVNARKEIDKAVEGFAKIFKADAKIAKNRNIDLVNAARFILGHYGLGPRDVEPAKFVEQLRAYNPDLYADIEPILLDATTGPRNYKKLTLNEFRDMKEIVDALWFKSKRENEVMIEGKAVALDSIIGELNARLDEIGVPAEVAGERMAPGKIEKAIRALYNAKALTRRVEHWADATDGAAGPGPFTNYIWRPLRAALDQYRVDRNRYVKDYVDMIAKLDLPVAKINAPELNYTFGNENGGIGKAEVLGALMHIGNDSNMKKLLVGRGWGQLNEDGSVDTSRWNTFMNRMINESVLTKADFDFVQSVWDLNEEIKPMAQDAHREIFGYYFKEVEARPVVTPFGTYRGGYVPAKTDPFIVRDAQRQAKMEELESDFRNAMPSTGSGFTLSRVEYNKPLSLDIRVMAKHIDDVIRFARVQPTIRDTLKILRKRDFADTLTRIDPTVIEDMLIPWLNRSARQITSEVGMNKSIDTFWRAVRNRTGIGIMFANITNALQQVTGFFTALLKVQGKYMKSSLADYMKSPTAQAEFVAELSPFMADRMSNQMVELQDMMNDLLINPTKFDKIQNWSKKHGYFLQQAFQNFVDVVTWVGAYNQAVAEAGVDVSEEAASKEAIKRADAAVRLTQTSLQPEDLSAFEVGSPFYRTLIQFSGYFNMIANLNANEYIKIFRDLGWRGHKGKLFMTYLLGFGLPMLVADAIVQSLGGGWDDEDDDGYMDVFMSWFFGSQLRGAVALVPFGTAATVPFNAFNNKPYDDRITTSPSISTLEGATVGVVKAGINIADPDKDVTGKNVRDILTLISLSTGIPVTVLGRPIGYAIEVERGKIKPTSDVDYLRGLATGKASESSRQ